MFSRWDYWQYRRWRRRRCRRILFFLAVVFLLGAAVAAHATGTHARHAHTVSPGRHGSPAAHRGPVKAAPTARPGRPRIGAAGTDLRWVDFHGIELPVSAQDGPRQEQRGLVRGFTDTPRGALLAAVNIGVRTAALWGPAIYRPTIRHQVTGPDQGALLTADTSDFAALRAASPVRSGQPAGRGYSAEAGFRFVAYTPADATVDLVTEGPGAGGANVLVATRVEVVWLYRDWRVVAPPGGSWASSATVIASLTGYTPFGTQG
jgi:hypothetical protein